MDTGNRVTTYNLPYNEITNPNTPKEKTKVFPWLQIDLRVTVKCSTEEHLAHGGEAQQFYSFMFSDPQQTLD